tara:strand:- start:147 stop:1664 length:1518 start_codon:yes stop_codon:yes gene_type:complete
VYSYNKFNFQYKKIYSRYLEKLTLILNSYHQKQYNRDYWEPIIGLYLRNFIIKYHLFKKKDKRNYFKNGNLKNIKFYKSYIDFADDQNYFFYKFKQINLKKNYIFKKINYFKSIINYLKIIIPNFLIDIGILKVFFSESYFKKKLKNFFTLRSFLKFYSLPSLNFENYDFDKNLILKNRLNLIYSYSKQNKKDVFLNNLIIFMPINYVEKYGIILNEVKKINISEAIYIDGNEVKFDFIKFYIAELKLKNKKIIFGQHSLRTGLEDYNIYFDYLKSVSSFFLTWGWNRKEKKIIPFSSMRIFSSINKYKKIKKINNDNLSICYILCSYPGSGECIYENQFENFKAEKARINLLEKIKKIKNLKITLKPRHGSFLIRNKKNFYKKFNLLKYKTRMYNVLNNNEIFLFERLSLGIAECLYLDRPTIFYYPKNLYKQKNKEYRELIYLLKKANIFFDDKNKVSELLSSKANISNWWNSKKNTKNRKKFLINFAKCFNYDDLGKIKKLI